LIVNIQALETLSSSSTSTGLSPLSGGMAADTASANLKSKSIRAGVITTIGQITKLVVQTGSTMVLARLLAPSDFGLIGMVTAVTGALMVIGDAGLSSATVQQEKITTQQLSTLFWINAGLGLLFALLLAGAAPLIVRFYHEPRLNWIIFGFAFGILASGCSAQHKAMLRREMRFKSLAWIEIVSMVASALAAMTLALFDFGYWSLVCLQVGSSIVTLLALLVAYPWVPGRPAWSTQIGGMLRFGGYLTGSNISNYLFRNADSILIGRFCGSGPLGLYSKAYSLLLLPISQINSPISSVAVSSLSRLQGNPERMRRYFVAGYSIAVSLTVPTVAVTTIFAEEVILFMLGQQWVSAVPLFRLLAPAALIGAVLNPFGWLFVATGRSDRQFWIGLVWSLITVAGFAAGISFGPEGVAVGYSITSLLLAAVVAGSGIRGTSVRWSDLVRAVISPSLAMVIAGLLGLYLKFSLFHDLTSWVRLILGSSLTMGAYAGILLFALGKRDFYLDLVKTYFKRD
jgi:O-antigen/teichoic acid export membrane protein